MFLQVFKHSGSLSYMLWVFTNHSLGTMHICTTFIVIHPIVVETFHSEPKVRGSPIRIYPLGNLNICSKCHGNPSDSYDDISHWTKVVDLPTDWHWRDTKSHTIVSLSLSWHFLYILIVTNVLLTFKIIWFSPKQLSEQPWFCTTSCCSFPQSCMLSHCITKEAQVRKKPTAQKKLHFWLYACVKINTTWWVLKCMCRWKHKCLSTDLSGGITKNVVVEIRMMCFSQLTELSFHWGVNTNNCTFVYFATWTAPSNDLCW